MKPFQTVRCPYKVDLALHWPWRWVVWVGGVGSGGVNVLHEDVVDRPKTSFNKDCVDRSCVCVFVCLC